MQDPRGPSRPFCSERCKLLDLGRWLGEEYRVAAYDDPVPSDGEGASEGASWPSDENG